MHPSFFNNSMSAKASLRPDSRNSSQSPSKQICFSVNSPDKKEASEMRERPASGKPHVINIRIEEDYSIDKPRFYVKNSLQLSRKGSTVEARLAEALRCENLCFQLLAQEVSK
jgi:hypothetical protein